MGTAPSIKVNRSITKSLRLFDADRFRWLDEAAALGPLVSLQMGPVKVWVVTDADAARSMLVNDAASWTRPPATLAPIRVGVGENLFTQSDKNWAKLQPSVAPAFAARRSRRDWPRSNRSSPTRSARSRSTQRSTSSWRWGGSA